MESKVTPYPIVNESDVKVCFVKYLVLQTIYQLEQNGFSPTSTEIKLILLLLKKYSKLKFFLSLELDLGIICVKNNFIRICDSYIDEIIKILIFRKVVIQRKGRHTISKSITLAKFSMREIDLIVEFYVDVLINFISTRIDLSCYRCAEYNRVLAEFVSYSRNNSKLKQRERKYCGKQY